MIYGKQPITFTVAQLGALNRAEVENSVGLANQIQKAFRFEFHPRRFPLDKKRYRLPNSGYALEEVIKHIIQTHDLPRPLIFVTAAPYGERASGKRPDWFYFSDLDLSLDPTLGVMSTYIWEEALGHSQLQPYILCHLASAILIQLAKLEVHNEKRGCLFDYWGEFEDIDLVLKAEGLCNNCERDLNARLRSGDITVEQVAAAKKLFNRACGRRVCFMILPFTNVLKPVYKLVSQTLRDEGWTVMRADEIIRPRRITDAILQATLMSDLVVADLTGSNPNVFYELGLAHASGCDVIMLTQEQKIPFDVTTESAIFYKPHARGLRELEQQLRRLAGTSS